MSAHLSRSLAATLAALSATAALTGGPAVTRAWPPGPPVAAAPTHSRADLHKRSTAPLRARWVVHSTAALDGALAGGTFHTCSLTSEGVAYCWGYNGMGELGTGSAGGSRLVPTAVAGGRTFTSLSAGGLHTCGVGTDSAAYCWGDNRKGQLGDGTTEQRAAPVAVAGNGRFRAISAGVDFTCGVTVAGAAYCWGGNEDGQRGDSTTSPSAKPTPVRGERSFVSISAGAHHTCALSADGAAYCWGGNASGELGDGAGGRPGARALVPVPVRGGHVFSQVATGLGARFTCGVAADGIFCWGDGRQGQLGPGAPDVCAGYGYPCATTPHAVEGLADAQQVSLGTAHACALVASGEVRCWGLGTSGRLGSGTPLDRMADQPAGAVTDEEAYQPTPAPVAAGGDVRFVGVAATAAGACARTASGQTLCWGSNALGTVGDGTTEDRAVPTPVSAPDMLPSPLPGPTPTSDTVSTPPTPAADETDADGNDASGFPTSNPVTEPAEVSAHSVSALAASTPSAISPSAISPSAPQVALVNSDSVVSRDDCLTIAAGAHGAYQCGDLRIVHPLPSIRTRNRPWTPTLVYNSQHARPTPLLAADVTVPAAADVPDTVVTTALFVEWGRSWTRRWPGSAWGSAGTTRRIAVPADSIPTPYQPLEAFTVDVAFCYNGVGCYHTVQTSTQLILDRRSSPFGAGWWIAGLEHLFTSAIVAVSGDGTAAPYRATGIPATAAKVPLDRPDTLRSYYDYDHDPCCELLNVRQADHGGKVIFHETGSEQQAISRLGDSTRFGYDQSGRLTSIELPPGGPAATYTFAYPPGQVQVTAPPAGSTARVTTIFLTGARVDSIRDPDARAVSFTYDGSTARINSRTDKLGWATKYAYDAGGKLAVDSVPLNAGEYAVTRFEPAESRGILQAVHPDSAYTLVNGPRADVSDITRFWVGRFGAPRKIVNALGDSTVLTRGSATFPALVTEMRAPNGFATRATYDARGNIETSTQVKPYSESSQDAVTTYEWDPKWDFVTKVVRPERDSLLMAYDTATGNRLWEQDARGAATRVSYFYSSSSGLLDSLKTPLASRAERYAYDALRNLGAVTTPLGVTTTYSKDALGRDTLVVTPIGGSDTQRKRIVYDVMDRDVEVQDIGQVAGAPAQILTVRKRYTAEGELDSLAQSTSPDPNGVGETTTRWRYDRAGRRVKEIAPDGFPAAAVYDSTGYDPAGNAVAQVTRRGHHIAMQYDALNRLTQRTVPQVVEPDTVFGGVRYPLHWHGSGSLTLPADVQQFTYDAVGNMLTASNVDARISRSYNPNGTLASDTLRVATWDRTDFTRHAYGLKYRYDLNGRRVLMLHPRQMAPQLSGTPRDTVAYGYGRDGRLASVTDPFGDAFVYRYDLEGRLDSLGAPGGVYQRWMYDDDGRVMRRVLRGLNYRGFTDTNAPTDTVQSMYFAYDARGKLLRAKTYTDSARSQYDGLGALLSMHRQPWPLNAQNTGKDATEYFTPDPLGRNNYREEITGSGREEVDTLRYERGTGRLLEMRPRPGTIYRFSPWDSTSYDRQGNTRTLQRNEYAQKTSKLDPSQPNTVGVREKTINYYGADEKLRVVDRRTDAPANVPSVYYGAFDEYRYDALGRRVATLSRRDSSTIGLTASAGNSIERYVWDGDQLLYETHYRPNAAPADSSQQAVPSIEWDTVTVWSKVPCGGTGVGPPRPPCGGVDTVTLYDTTYSTFYGRVAYTHGAGIDEPLSIIRVGYGQDSVLFEPFAVMPFTDWRGSYERAFTSGGYTTQIQYVFRPDGTYYADSLDLTRQIPWPAPDMRAYLRAVPSQEPQLWFGGLIAKQSTNARLLYMRNRYYDPVRGQFTQEDPIGLAGGMNLYGFANGDPVNYSDPFGLARCPPDCSWEDIKGYIKQFVEDVRSMSWADWKAAIRGGAEMVGGANVEMMGPAVGAGAKAAPAITSAYKRPAGATTAAQRAAVQGQPCVKCGATAPTMVAGHKKALVEEYYETGAINQERMRSVQAVQPECPTCSAKEGATMSRYSQQKKRELGLPDDDD